MRKEHTMIVFGMIWMLSATASPIQSQETDALPWTIEDLRQAYTPGFEMVFTRSGTNDKGNEVGGTHTFAVKDAWEQAVQIDSIWEDGPERSSGHNQYYWDQDLMFLESMSGARYEIVGTEQVETPAGTFDTVVVEVTREFFDELRRHTYWMIADQPGVYAKFVYHGSEQKPADLVRTLQKVTYPGS